MFLSFHQKSIILPFVVIVEKVQKPVHEKREKSAALLFNAVGIQIELAEIATGDIGPGKTLWRGICVDRVRRHGIASYIKFE